MNFDILRLTALNFLKNLEIELETNQISLEKHWMVDHLCYRTADLEEYDKIKSSFIGFSQMLAETEVNGRPIATFKLQQGLVWREQEIFIVEVPAPKAGKNVKSGFEHIEVVCDESFESLIKRFSDLKLDRNGLNKSFNPELEIELKECAIKFHHISLESVVNFESHPHIKDNNSLNKLLQKLRDYDCLITGTLPLQIDNPKSDLDLMITVTDQSDFNKLVQNLQKNWTLEVSDNFITLFTDDLKIEILAGQIPSTEQPAFLHFLIEERLLRIGGEKLKKIIIDLKQKGIKTEPAFAKALKLEGDPYQILLKIQKYPESKIKSEILRQFN